MEKCGFSYDSFGNRLSQAVSTTPCGSTPPLMDWATYNSRNQVTSSTMAPSGPVYDPSGAGNVISDANTGNSYLYDGEGRICAVKSEPVGGTYAITGYIYDAEGNRVAKGNLASFSCGAAITITNTYVIGPSGEQLTETDGNGNWKHTNVYAAGALIATYDQLPSGTQPLHFQLADWLGSRRVQTDYAGNTEESFSNLPFGDGLSSTQPPNAPTTADDATEHHFTGKERDSESGNDYFGARYFSSGMGRFMSPDPSGLSAQNPSNPQTWNLYVYTLNNPLIYTDPTGLDCVYINDSGTGVELDANGNDTIDHNSTKKECGKSGGDWVDGYTQANWVGYDKTNDEFNIGSIDNGNVEFTQATAPHGSGFWASIFGCTGNCTTGQSSIGFGDLQSQLQPTGASVSNLLGWLARQTSIPSPGSMGNMPVQFQLVSGFCGPGGYGVPNGSSDWGCVAHDFQYAITGNTYPNPTDPNYKGGPQLKNINQTLCDNTTGAIHLAAEFTFKGIWGCN